MYTTLLICNARFGFFGEFYIPVFTASIVGKNLTIEKILSNRIIDNIVDYKPTLPQIWRKIKFLQKALTVFLFMKTKIISSAKSFLEFNIAEPKVFETKMNHRAAVPLNQVINLFNNFNRSELFCFN